MRHFSDIHWTLISSTIVHYKFILMLQMRCNFSCPNNLKSLMYKTLLSVLISQKWAKFRNLYPLKAQIIQKLPDLTVAKTGKDSLQFFLKFVGWKPRKITALGSRFGSRSRLSKDKPMGEFTSDLTLQSKICRRFSRGKASLLANLWRIWPKNTGIKLRLWVNYRSCCNKTKNCKDL